MELLKTLIILSPKSRTGKVKTSPVSYVHRYVYILCLSLKTTFDVAISNSNFPLHNNVADLSIRAH